MELFFLFGYVPSFPFFEKVKKALSISAFKQQTEVRKVSNTTLKVLLQYLLLKTERLLTELPRQFSNIYLPHDAVLDVLRFVSGDVTEGISLKINFLFRFHFSMRNVLHVTRNLSVQILCSIVFLGFIAPCCVTVCPATSVLAQFSSCRLDVQLYIMCKIDPHQLHPSPRKQ